MGELQHLSMQFETSPLMRTCSGLLPSKEQQQFQVALRQEAVQGGLQKARVAIAVDVAMDAMEGVKQVDAYRRSLAGEDQVLNALLGEVEVGFVQQLQRIQRGSAI